MDVAAGQADIPQVAVAELRRTAPLMRAPAPETPKAYELLDMQARAGQGARPGSHPLARRQRMIDEVGHGSLGLV
jgi:hypothetical protein